MFEDSSCPINVFGRMVEKTRPYLWLFNGGILVERAKRIDDHSLNKMNVTARKIMLQTEILNFSRKK